MSDAIRDRREQMRKSSREEAEAIFRLAGIEVVHAWELANGYWPDAADYDEVRVPWWLFLTAYGPIQIGRRKRVIHIQWDACAIRGALTIDDVTKSDTYVHAWSAEKAIEYLRAIPPLHAAASLAVEREKMRRGEIPVSTEEWARRRAEQKKETSRHEGEEYVDPVFHPVRLISNRAVVDGVEVRARSLSHLIAEETEQKQQERKGQHGSREDGCVGEEAPGAAKEGDGR